MIVPIVQWSAILARAALSSPTLWLYVVQLQQVGTESRYSADRETNAKNDIDLLTRSDLLLGQNVLIEL